MSAVIFTSEDIFCRLWENFELLVIKNQLAKTSNKMVQQHTKRPPLHAMVFYNTICIN